MLPSLPGTWWWDLRRPDWLTLTSSSSTHVLKQLGDSQAGGGTCHWGGREGTGLRCRATSRHLRHSCNTEPMRSCRTQGPLPRWPTRSRAGVGPSLQAALPRGRAEGQEPRQAHSQSGEAPAAEEREGVPPTPVTALLSTTNNNDSSGLAGLGLCSSSQPGVREDATDQKEQGHRGTRTLLPLRGGACRAARARMQEAGDRGHQGRLEMGSWGSRKPLWLAFRAFIMLPRKKAVLGRLQILDKVGTFRTEV